MEVRDYDLPDAVLLEDAVSTYRHMVWEPGFTAVILGQSNSPGDSLFVDRIIEDRIPVYKRPSGGMSVVLSPNTVVISVLKRGERLQSPYLYFKDFNQKIIDALSSLGIRELRADGISDICIGAKKILGSSIYRNKDIVLYHAVLNRSESTDILERYLKHPPKEPEYRRGRGHGDFVTSLSREGYRFSAANIRDVVARELLKE
jgi:lipoate-protein ligase A